WRREFGTFPILGGFGTGASLTLEDGKVIVECYNEKQSFQAAVDTNTGSEVWRNALIPGSSWATPLVWRNSLRTELISCGKGLVTSVDPETGKEYWRLGQFDTAFASSPTCAGDRLYFGASSPGSSSPFFVVQAGAHGDISLEKGTSSNAFVVWHKNGMGPGMCSVLEKDGLLYTMGTGILTCYDAQTGERIYRERIPKAGSFAANPICHGDKLYFLDENGVTHVIQTGRQFKLLGSNPLPRETYWSSPALGKNCLLIRGTEHLYCIREPNR
ncbi:MAG TPA: PQQ-binding-like beta-propeller repeat protein, partial [Gemmatales bacterium]|nr:PQQ-binding-like beta-propeller repeat protein [Gemmatales bacterium]